MLIVEDSPVNLEVAVAILESMGCTVETAVNGHHALDRHANGEYSLIFMDCQMPEIDGYEATREIRRQEGSLRHVVIIAMTAEALGRDRCIESGMDDFIPKPVRMEDLAALTYEWSERMEAIARNPNLPPNRSSSTAESV